MKKECSVSGCENLTKTRIKKGFCNAHYLRFQRKGDPAEGQPVRGKSLSAETAEEIFWRNIQKGSTVNACWEWMGEQMPSKTACGYGRFYFQGKRYKAHRYSFFIHNGYWAKPMTLHKCDNPPCCNPLHLYEGNAQDNIRDAIDRGRHKGSRSPLGYPFHPLLAANGSGAALLVHYRS